MGQKGASEFALDALVSVWLHVTFDIPILGLMDDFVLYTDINVLLQLFIGDIFGKICWERSTTGATGAAPAPHVREGIPKYVAVAELLRVAAAPADAARHARRLPPLREPQATSETEATTIADTFATSFATSCVSCFLTSFYKSSISILPRTWFGNPTESGQTLCI